MGLERLSFNYRDGSNPKARGPGGSCQKGARFVGVPFSFHGLKGGRHGAETTVSEKGHLALHVQLLPKEICHQNKVTVASKVHGLMYLYELWGKPKGFVELFVFKGIRWWFFSIKEILLRWLYLTLTSSGMGDGSTQSYLPTGICW